MESLTPAGKDRGRQTGVYSSQIAFARVYHLCFRLLRFGLFYILPEMFSLLNCREKMRPIELVILTFVKQNRRKLPFVKFFDRS